MAPSSASTITVMSVASPSPTNGERWPAGGRFFYPHPGWNAERWRVNSPDHIRIPNNGSKFHLVELRFEVPIRTELKSISVSTVQGLVSWMQWEVPSAIPAGLSMGEFQGWILARPGAESRCDGLLLHPYRRNGYRAIGPSPFGLVSLNRTQNRRLYPISLCPCSYVAVRSSLLADKPLFLFCLCSSFNPVDRFLGIPDIGEHGSGVFPEAWREPLESGVRRAEVEWVINRRNRPV